MQINDERVYQKQKALWASKHPLRHCPTTGDYPAQG
jgi:hypothetical protein